VLSPITKYDIEPLIPHNSGLILLHLIHYQSPMRSARPYVHDREYSNPMSEVKESPLKKYEHLLPEAALTIHKLDQYLFLGTIIDKA
jgi:hypothetical protein